MANQIAYFGVQQGYEKLFDFLDMNCGAIPEGPYEQIVDPQAPEQFLQMYSKIAQKRFAFACTALLNMNKEYLPALKDFMYRTGKEMEINTVGSSQEAECIFKSFYLEGPYEQVWKEACGDPKIFEQLVECFKKGLLSLEE